MYNNSSSEDKYSIDAFYDRRLPVTVMLALFSVVGLPGNFLVLVVNWREKQLTNTNVLICTMAVADFIGACTAILNVVKNSLWFQILDIKFCKITMMLNYSINTPGMYLIFGVSVVRYCHVCKPHKVYSIYKKIKPFCICVLTITLTVAVTIAICADRTNRNGDKFQCGLYHQNKCEIAINVCLIFIITSYIFCFNGLIGLNIRILQRMFKQRRIMSDYRNVRQYKLERKMKKSLRSSRRTETTTESVHTSVHELSDSSAGLSVKDDFSDKTKSSKNEESESPIHFNLEENPENSIEHQKHPRRKSSKIKYKRKSIELTSEKEIDSKLISGTGRKEKRTKYKKNDVTLKEFKEGETSKPNRVSFGRISVKNNNTVNNDEKDCEKTQNYNTKRISFPNKRSIARSITEHEVDKQLEKRCYGKCCLHKCKHVLKFEGFNRTTLKLSFVSIAYLLIYMPWFVLHVYILLDPISEYSLSVSVNKYLYFPVLYLPFAGCAVNPVIYTFVDPKFRSQVRALFQ